MKTHGMTNTRIMRAKILGKYWNISFQPASKMPGMDGCCSHPEEPHRHIKIRTKLRGERELDVVIHECLHAAGWHIDHDFVSDFASDVARLLWRLGYRQTESHQREAENS